MQPLHKVYYRYTHSSGKQVTAVDCELVPDPLTATALTRIFYGILPEFEIIGLESWTGNQWVPVPYLRP